jgi:MFS family permease
LCTGDRAEIHAAKIIQRVSAGPSPRVVLAAATSAQAAISFVNFGLPSIGPELRAQFGMSLAELGAALTAGLLGSGLALIAAGIAVDRLGAAASTLGGTVVAAAALVLAAAAGSAGMLFAGLVLFGIGSAVVPIAGVGTLFRAYPPARRAWALGVRQMAVPLGGTVASVAMPLLQRAGGVQAALAVAAGAVAVTGVAFALLPDEPRVQGLGSRPSGAFRSIWRAPGMQRLLLVAGFYIVVLQAVLAYTVPAVRAAGLSAFVASATYFVVNVTAMVARIVWGKVADRQEGARRSRTLAEVGLVATAGALLFTLALHADAPAVVAAAVVFGFGALGWNALIYVSAGERADPELAGRSVAVAATVIFLLSAACTPPLGALAANAGWDAFWLATAAIALVGALLARSLPRLAG